MQSQQEGGGGGKVVSSGGCSQVALGEPEFKDWRVDQSCKLNHWMDPVILFSHSRRKRDQQI